MFIFIAIMMLMLYVFANVWVMNQFIQMYPGMKYIWLTLFFFLAGAALATMVIRNHAVIPWIGKVGNYYLAFLFLAIVFFSLTKWLPFPSFYLAVGLILITFLFGTIQAHRIQIVPYELTIKKPLEHSMKVALISDLHLGYVNDEKKLKKIVQKINDLAVDSVWIAGDIFDSNYYAIKNPDQIVNELNRLQAHLGVYGVWGNHDAGSSFEQMKNLMDKTQVVMLEDEIINQGAFQIGGRLDARPIGDQGKKRKLIQNEINEQSNELPLFILDHQPSKLNEYDEKVDLVVAGHTHKGQIWPFGWITKKMFEVDYGHKTTQKGTQVVVSSGVGFWGPPIRIGTKSEIVILTINKGENKYVAR